MIRLGVPACLVLLLSMGAVEPTGWTGQVAVKGNEPFTVLVLTDQGAEWQLTGPREPELRTSAQGLRIRVQGKLVRDHVIEVETWVRMPDETPR